MSPWMRVITKVGAFSFVLFFIFFFVVHGYRYTDGVGFMTKNAFYGANFWSDESVVSFDGNSYTAVDNKVELFNIDAGCYNITFHNKSVNHCIFQNSVTFDTFVEYKGSVPYHASLFSSCTAVSRQSHGTYSVENVDYSRPIQSVFIAREIPFVQVDNKLFACTHDYKNCQELTNVSGDPVCSTKAGVVYNDN
ncbi:MAG: hypothetical protein WCJ81_02060 [bacterium]